MAISTVITARRSMVRTDRNQPADQVRFMAHDDYFHVITGPAAVFYHPEWKRSGDYRVSARFTQNKAPHHPEAYGLVVGGADLAGAGQQYAYLLVRGTGEYFIALRRGNERVKVVDWTAHPAVVKQDASGQAANVLAIETKGNQVLFLVNGQQVAQRPRAEIAPDGIFGLRINHNLDVKVDQVTR
jgi:hypothetical protein